MQQFQQAQLVRFITSGVGGKVRARTQVVRQKDLSSAFLSPGWVDRAATNASCGTSTRPIVFIRFLPSFCFSSSLRLRVMSPP